MNQTDSKINRTAIAVASSVSLLLAGAGCSLTERRPLSSVDVDAIKAADQAYATAWLTNDPQQVMATVTEDAVLIPAGIPVVEGADAIRDFWWPTDSPPTTVTEFTLAQREVAGSGDFGFVRGSFTLSFEYDGNTFLNRGDYLSLLRRLPDASWRISHRVWNDHPQQTD